MTTLEMVIVILAFIVAGALLISSIRSFMNRGFLFNNAFLYAIVSTIRIRGKK